MPEIRSLTRPPGLAELLAWLRQSSDNLWKMDAEPLSLLQNKGEQTYEIRKILQRKEDLFSGIVLSAFSIAYLIGATRIKIPKMLSSSFLNASSVPKLWGTLLLILGIILVIRGVRVMKAEKAAGNAPEKKPLHRW